MKLYIKYMVSIRCIMVVKSILKKTGINYQSVILGEVDLSSDISIEKQEQLKKALLKAGLELIETRKAMIIEKIKIIIIELVHYSDEYPKIVFSDYLKEKLNYDYTYLANLFSETEAMTIEQFIIRHKIERVKELIIYDEFTLSEIAFKLQYSSLAHLSSQFKRITGLTPTYFKALKDKKRNSLENL